MVAAMTAPTSAVPANPGFDPDSEIVLVCTASGASHVRPQTTAEQVCEGFKRGLDVGLGQVTRADAVQPSVGNVIRVELRIASDRAASARVITVARGKTTDWPEFSIDAMDKPLGMDEIEQLAGDVATAIDHS